MRRRAVLFIVSLLLFTGCGVHVVKGGPVDSVIQTASQGKALVGSVVQGARQAAQLAGNGINAAKQGIATVNADMQQMQEGAGQIRQGVATLKNAVRK